MFSQATARDVDERNNKRVGKEWANESQERSQLLITRCGWVTRGWQACQEIAKQSRGKIERSENLVRLARSTKSFSFSSDIVAFLPVPVYMCMCVCARVCVLSAIFHRKTGFFFSLLDTWEQTRNESWSRKKKKKQESSEPAKIRKIKRPIIDLDVSLRKVQTTLDIVVARFVVAESIEVAHTRARSSRKRATPLDTTTRRQMTKESSLERRQDTRRDSTEVFARSYKRGTGGVEGSRWEFGLKKAVAGWKIARNRGRRW